MNTVALDTSVLLAIFKGEPSGEQWIDRLQSISESAALLVSSVVYAEVRSFFSSDGACQRALADLDVAFGPIGEESALLAGRMFRDYRKKGGLRSSILPDFLVAAHAATEADALATVDRGYLREYFPKIQFIALHPDS